MVNLTTKMATELIRVIDATGDDEIPCGECLNQLAEYVDAELTGRPLADALRLVTHHLELCRDCGEEYDALRRAVESLHRAADNP